jgi:hypothetical protein
MAENVIRIVDADWTPVRPNQNALRFRLGDRRGAVWLAPLVAARDCSIKELLSDQGVSL